MNDELQDWPILGRLGVSRAPATYGQHVYVVAENVDGYWTLLCEHPASNFMLWHNVMSDDNYFNRDEDTLAAITAWQVEWLPEGPEEAELERRIFDYRSQVVAAMRPKWWHIFRRRSRSDAHSS